MPSQDTSLIESSSWETVLDGAFEVLLGGKPADDADAVYGVYYASDSLDEFLLPNSWATPDALVGSAPRELPNPDGDYPFSPSEWRFDLSESLFRFDSHLLDETGPWGEDGHKGPRPFSDAFVADVRVASVRGATEVLVRGAQLGPLLTHHGIDLAKQAFKRLNCWLTVVLRVSTDGTLTDAMRAATFTTRGPAHLVPFGEECYSDGAEARWEEALQAIRHPALRDHLRMLCLAEEDSRSCGAHHSDTDRWPFDTDVLEQIGCSLVTGWEFGERQAGTAVVRLPIEPGRRKP